MHKRERNQEIYCTLQPGMYVILAGTHVAGMDRPFRISILSNYEMKNKQVRGGGGLAKRSGELNELCPWLR